MNREKIFGILRHIITFGAGAVGSAGYLGDSDPTQVASAIMLLIGVAWSVLAPEKKAA